MKIRKREVKKKRESQGFGKRIRQIQRKRGTQTDARYQDPPEMTLDCG